MSGPPRGWKSTGFQVGWRFVASCTPSATFTPGDQRPFSCRATQMLTSGSPSSVPPNQAAISWPDVVSTSVEAWTCGYGPFS